MAKHFGASNWKVSAIKSYMGHSLGVAGADQLASSLGIWQYGILPGILTTKALADDVHTQGLDFLLEHEEVGVNAIDSILLNAKGFGEYSEGFIPVANPLFNDQLPGCSVTDDFTKALGSPNEALLAAAINYAETGLCPPEDKPSPQTKTQPNNQGLAIKKRATRLDLMLEENKIYTTIREPSL